MIPRGLFQPLPFCYSVKCTTQLLDVVKALCAAVNIENKTFKYLLATEVFVSDC